MNQIKIKTFESEIFKEYSASPNLEPLGKAKCTMELFMSIDESKGRIEWEVEYENGDYDYEEIGLWFDEHKCLTDYDGVFSMPKQAIELLEECGYNSDYAK
jgi:hypothetical protein